MVVEDLYGEKLSLFEELGQLSQKMVNISHEELMNDDASFTEFQNLLQKRASLMKKIDQLTKKINKLEVEENLEFQTKLFELAKAIDEKNENIEKSVKIALEDLKQQSRKLQEGIQTNRAYIGRKPSGEGSFIDKRS